MDDGDDDRRARRGGTVIAMEGTEERVGWGAGRKRRRLWDYHARRDLHSIWCLVDIPCEEPGRNFAILLYLPNPSIDWYLLSCRGLRPEDPIPFLLTPWKCPNGFHSAPDSI